MPTFREQIEAIIAHRDRYDNLTDEILSFVRQLAHETVHDSSHNTPAAERNVRKTIKTQLLERPGVDERTA